MLGACSDGLFAAARRRSRAPQSPTSRSRGVWRRRALSAAAVVAFVVSPAFVPADALAQFGVTRLTVEIEGAGRVIGNSIVCESPPNTGVGVVGANGADVGSGTCRATFKHAQPILLQAMETTSKWVGWKTGTCQDGPAREACRMRVPPRLPTACPGRPTETCVTVRAAFGEPKTATTNTVVTEGADVIVQVFGDGQVQGATGTCASPIRTPPEQLGTTAATIGCRTHIKRPLDTRLTFTAFASRKQFGSWTGDICNGFASVTCNDLLPVGSPKPCPEDPKRACYFIAARFTAQDGPYQCRGTPGPECISWEMRPRLGVESILWGGIRQLGPNRRPGDGYDVMFSACGDPQVQSVRWEFDPAPVKVEAYRGITATDRRPLCRMLARFEKPGPHVARVLVTDDEGRQSEQVELRFVLRDWLIASIGDSYAAGEGSPDSPQQFDLLGHVTDSAKWNESRACHRSQQSPAGLYATRLEKQSTQSVVTFVTVACTGAPLKAMLDGGYHEYVTEVCCTEEAPQFDSLKQRLGSRPVDALILDGGGNDSHFGDFLRECAPAVSDKNCDGDDPDTGRVLKGVKSLTHGSNGGLYGRLHLALEGLKRERAVGGIYFVGYPDPTHDDGGRFRQLPGVLQGLTRGEVVWAYKNFLVPLNAAMQEAATSHGYTFVPTAELFLHHGYSAKDRWFNRAEDSVLNQGPLTLQGLEAVATLATGLGMPLYKSLKADFAATNGTMHPNARGYNAMADALQAAVRLPSEPLVLGGGGGGGG